MKFSSELIEGVLIRRYKRFLADVIVEDKELTVHCPNTGSMKNCIVEGSPCWLLDSQNPKRKYRYGWELATTPSGDLACINSARANAVVKEAVAEGRVEELLGYHDIKTEVKYGENSRIDLLLGREGELCYVEVKSVTYGLDEGAGIFPDAKSDRATKHLRELIQVKASGARAVLFFCVQHNGIEHVSPADEIDPVYGKVLREAIASGVEVIAYRAHVSVSGIELRHSLPVVV